MPTFPLSSCEKEKKEIFQKILYILGEKITVRTNLKAILIVLIIININNLMNSIKIYFFKVTAKRLDESAPFQERPMTLTSHVSHYKTNTQKVGLFSSP